MHVRPTENLIKPNHETEISMSYGPHISICLYIIDSASESQVLRHPTALMKSYNVPLQLLFLMTGH